MKLSAALVVVVLGCGGQKQFPDEDFAELAALDAKSDAFSAKLRVLGALAPGQSRDVYYTPTPRFRGWTLAGAGPVDLWVRSQTGDSLAWLLDGKFKVLQRNDDADDSTYDSHLGGTLEGGATYYLVMRDYDYAHGWFTVSRAPDAADLSCSGTGRIGTVPDECMDDGGANAVGDSLEVYCFHHVARFCLSGEACPWRSKLPSSDDGETCSRAGIGDDPQGPDFMVHAWCQEWRSHAWTYCGADGQVYFQ